MVTFSFLLFRFVTLCALLDIIIVGHYIFKDLECWIFFVDFERMNNIYAGFVEYAWFADKCEFFKSYPKNKK